MLDSHGSFKILNSIELYVNIVDDNASLNIHQTSSSNQKFKTQQKYHS